MKNFQASDLSPTGLENWKFRLPYSVTNEDLVDSPLWWHLEGLSQTASGYGNRLTTSSKVSFEGKLYRVYCTLWSNSGTCWFQTKKYGTIIVS